LRRHPSLLCREGKSIEDAQGSVKNVAVLFEKVDLKEASGNRLVGGKQNHKKTKKNV
jgi:hypothetical protein